MAVETFTKMKCDILSPTLVNILPAKPTDCRDPSGNSGVSCPVRD